MTILKKAHSLTLLIALALISYGCGGGSETPDSPSEDPANPAQKASQSALPKGDPTKGQAAYTQSCSACHGPDATGLQGLGKDLTTSEFGKNLSDKEYLDFVKKGRATDDPLNTTGIAMLPKGGNPALSDAQIIDIVAYLRTLEK